MKFPRIKNKPRKSELVFSLLGCEVKLATSFLDSSFLTAEASEVVDA